jgi:glyoxylase-like metal-dependent hydrolase (beta-lactamase superfamily II)
MVTRELASGILQLQGGSNIGIVAAGGDCLLIDVGLDKPAARTALRAAEALATGVGSVLLTHAHADHFGGGSYVRRHSDACFYAPSLESAIMENPIIEPLCLFGGAAPMKDLRHKFTLAKPCKIDNVVTEGPLRLGALQIDVVPLPGHSLNQVGYGVGDVLFCADAVFPTETLQKHKVPYCVDLDRTLETLCALPEMPYATFAPGHGAAHTSPEHIAAACAENGQRLSEIRERVLTGLKGPKSESELVGLVARCLELELQNPATYLLTRTTILAALSSLERAGEVTAIIDDNQLLWSKV